MDIDLPADIAQSTDAWRASMQKLKVHDKPAFFTLKTRLPLQGRTNQVLAATDHLNVVLKTYASGGENELHAHTNEDHVFVVMQGRAIFFGPGDVQREVGLSQGILLPRGVVYKFQAEGPDPLVLLRVGSVIDPESDPLARVDEHGAPFDGYSSANHEVPCVLSETRWFG